MLFRSTDIDFYESYLADILREAGRKFYENGVSLNGIIQIFLQTPGLDKSFEWGIGMDRIFLGELLYNPEAVQEIVDRWMYTINSGEEVTLNSDAVLVMYVYEPPAGVDVKESMRFGYVVHQ